VMKPLPIQHGSRGFITSSGSTGTTEAGAEMGAATV
jgi:hypothetical protein